MGGGGERSVAAGGGGLHNATRGSTTAVGVRGKGGGKGKGRGGRGESFSCRCINGDECTNAGIPPNPQRLLFIEGCCVWFSCRCWGQSSPTCCW